MARRGSKTLSPLIQRLHKPSYRIPAREKDENALERLLALVLQMEDPYGDARHAVKVLRRSYAHWNEVRVARRFELRDALVARRVKRPEERAAMSQELLRRIFGLQNHLELDWLYDATSERRQKLLEALVVVPDHAGPALDLDAAAAEGQDQVPAVGTDLKRLLTRLGFLEPSAKDEEAGSLVTPFLRTSRRYLNYLSLALHARAVCESKHPRCRHCAVLAFCPHGKRMLGTNVWKAAVAELEAAARRPPERKPAAQPADSAATV